jgi:hypothetical protein
LREIYKSSSDDHIINKNIQKRFVRLTTFLNMAGNGALYMVKPFYPSLLLDSCESLTGNRDSISVPNNSKVSILYHMQSWTLSANGILLSGIVVDSNLKLQHEAKVDFDKDFGKKYGIEKGVLTNPDEGEVFAPPAMWLDAADLVLGRLKDAGLDFGKVMGVSGAGMQHGTVFWSKDAEGLLEGLDSKDGLVGQLGGGEGEWLAWVSRFPRDELFRFNLGSWSPGVCGTEC